MAHTIPQNSQDTFHQLLNSDGQQLGIGSSVTVDGRDTYIIGFTADGFVYVRAASGNGFDTVTPQAIGAMITKTPVDTLVDGHIYVRIGK